MTEFRPDGDSGPEEAPMSARELTCREVAAFLIAYEDGELSPAERSEFDAHLAVCPDCVAYLASYRTTVALGKQAFLDEDANAADEVPADLVRAVLAARRRNRRS
jgi:anti-sigma factor RsiW